MASFNALPRQELPDPLAAELRTDDITAD